MIEWKRFDESSPPKSGKDYLITDGITVDVAHFDDDLWFVPDMSNIDGHNAVTHFAPINLPKTATLTNGQV